ncbi:uncharacterized protein PV09_05232 [Verruconis gallopava]|uniref:Heterokaryon incompatibility domain-containing protein n=1 Tax=Verruconis gallopava TaxID=253628 RepID=A0A0D2A9Q0_9PEZI|nr:uncharacterized protein PV09_05232 [Verruconis gallopava]KIW03463.1 hypothetical protein PV09_05232 [Verruconis gallopava]
MAAEIRDALQQTFEKTGIERALCKTCTPDVAGRVLQLGLLDRVDGSSPSCGIKLRRPLNEAIEQFGNCWICTWLWLLAQRRQGSVLSAIPEAARSKAYLGIESQHVHTFEQGRTYSDSSKDERILVRMCIYFDARDAGQGFRYLVNLQHSEESPPRLTDLLTHLPIEKWSSYPPFDSRIRPRKAQLSLLRMWKETCEINHGSVCSTIRTNRVKDIRLIDIRNRCLVESTGFVSHAALSYCWGGPQPHCLKRSNLDSYRQPGGLNDSIVPKVIIDAMKITAALNEQYLWVDSLCIIQDDQLDKAKFLPVMDAIYEQAAVTIINGSNSSVTDSTGLPGVDDPNCRCEHEPFEFNGTWLTETLDPPYGSYGGGFLENARWSSRGWTFQEGMLSRKSIIVTQEQIYWQCQMSSWCEGSFWERSDDRQIFRHYFGDNLLNALFEQPMRIHWTDIYSSMLRNYLSRSFSSEADRLHGLMGILNKIESYTGEKFFWGLPQSRLEQGLVFTTTRSSRQRRESHTALNASGNLISSPFPTWSWFGWTGQVGLQTLHRSIAIGKIGLRFFKVDERGKTIRIDIPEDPPGPYPEGDTRRIVQYPPDAEHEWLDKTRQDVTSDDIPVDLRGHLNITPSLLCFWTSVATLRIEPLGPNNYYNEFCARISDGKNHVLGLWPGIREDFEFPLEGKFIVVGVEKERMSRGGRLTLKLLLVDHDQVTPSICRRKALVTTVVEEQWNRLTNRKWDLVFLT